MMWLLLTTLLIPQANVSDILFIDTEYVFSLLDPVAPWGEQHPHE